LWRREITVRGKAGKDRIVRIVRIGHLAAWSLDRYLRTRTRHAQAWRPQLWLGAGSREPLTAAGIYQLITRRGRQCGVDAYPHRFRHHFSHTWLERGGPEGDLMELNGWTCPRPPQLRPHHDRHLTTPAATPPAPAGAAALTAEFAGRCAAMGTRFACSRAARLVEVCQQAFAEDGHGPGLEVGGDVPGRHGRPGSAGSPGDGVDRADDLAGVKAE
jgi:hypothetical protein